MTNPQNMGQEHTLSHLLDSVEESTALPSSELSDFNGYRIIKEIGKGGMGIVYLAFQKSFNRKVALKVILGAAGKNEISRFRIEAEAIAKLQHANIIAVYEVTEYLGNAFYSMELCSGGTLANMFAKGPMQQRPAAEMLLKITKGLAAVHNSGIVHRDIKPSNILLTSDGEPKIADFGLAKMLNQGHLENLTHTGTILGTPCYMPPEQAAGLKDIGPKADIYSLGAVMYEALIGRPPFRGASVTETIMLVVTEDPVLPRSLRPEIHPSLESIILRCLHKDPARRYSSAIELANDLQRFLDGEQVAASGDSGILERLQSTVGHFRPDEKFAGYWPMLMTLAPIMLLPEVVATLVIANDWSTLAIKLSRLFQAILFIVTVLTFRKNDLWPRGPAERQLYAIWGGYFLSCFVFGLCALIIAANDKDAVATFNPLSCYPGFACITSIAFIATAANFWGVCLMISSFFLILAPLMTIALPLAPLMFGLTWFSVLCFLGIRLKKMSLGTMH